MKLLKKILLAVAVIILAIFLGLHTFVSIKGKDLLTKKLHSVFQSEVTVGRVTTSFPFLLIAKDVEVKNWFKIKKAFASTGIIDIFSGSFILSDLKLEGAEFSLEKAKREKNAEISAEVSPGGKAEGSKTLPVNQGAVTGSGIGNDFFLPEHIILKRLTISDGTFTYADYTKSETTINIKVRDLNIKLENFQWPFLGSVVTFFKINGRVPWENIKEEGRIEFEGWINFFKKDLRAKLEIKDIDGVYIYPYYSSWVNIDKARVEKARLNFSSNITSINNDVNAACHLELTQISFKPKEEQGKEPRMEKITNVVLGLLKAMNQGKIVLDFKLKTKLDNPEFGLGIIREAFKYKIYQSRKNQGSGAMEIIKFPGKVIGSTITSAADLTKSVINSTLTIGNEFKKAVEASFSKEDNSISNNKTAAENQTK